MAQRTRARTSEESTPDAAVTPTRSVAGNQARGNAAQADRTVAGGVGTSGDAARQIYRDYESRMWAQIGVIMGVQDAQQKAEQARAALAQAVRLQDRLALGETVDVDTLPLHPEKDESAYPVNPLPPEWVRAGRLLLDMAGGTGAPGASVDAGPIGSRDGLSLNANSALRRIQSTGREPADYGVPGYQTQSDNLASPEATCNGTSLSMVLERLGYTRDDLIRTIDTIIKRQVVTQQLRREGVREADIPARLAATDLNCVMAPDASWQAKVRDYLQAENRRGSGYQRPRGATASGAEVDKWSKSFKDQAGIDDLALMLMHTLGIERTEIAVGGNANKVLNAVHQGHGGAVPRTERIESSAGWTRTKATLKTVLEQGGSAMISVFHKGAGQSGTHIVAVQAVTAGGVVVDDPYGRQRADYTRKKVGDAYALPGKSRSTSGLKNQQDSNRDDWMRSSTRTAEEVRGESNEWPDQRVSESWNYILLFRRGSAASESTTGTPGASPTAPSSDNAAAARM